MDASALASAEYWLSVIGTAKLIGAFLVAVGVVLEFGGDFVARPFEKTVSFAREEQLASLKAASAQSVADAENARLELARFKAPRSLTPQQEVAVTEATRPFSRTPYDFSILASPEAATLMEQIASALDAAGWHRMPTEAAVVINLTNGAPAVGLIILKGVSIEISSSKQAEWTAPARALMDALAGAGIEADAKQNKGVSASAVHILIGIKP